MANTSPGRSRIAWNATPRSGRKGPISRSSARAAIEFQGPWGVSVAPNLTSDPEAGIARFSDAEMAMMITKGMRPDGTR